jgi:hypothetical protein
MVSGFNAVDELLKAIIEFLNEIQPSELQLDFRHWVERVNWVSANHGDYSGWPTKGVALPIVHGGLQFERNIFFPVNDFRFYAHILGRKKLPIHTVFEMMEYVLY